MTDKCNCGVKIMPKFIRKWLSEKFDECCKYHDYYYNDPDTSRFHADKIFLVDMVQASTNNRQVVLAITYFFTVRIFGFPFKKRKKDKE